MEEQRTGFLFRSMSLVMIAALLSRFLGFLREMAIAYRFGVSMETDAYLVAMLLPTVLFYAFSDALKNTFISIFTSIKSEKEAPLFLNTLTFYLAAGLLLFSLLGVFLAPQIVLVLAPGLAGEAGRLAVELTRILLPGIFFMGLAGLATGFLNSHHRFFVPALVNVPHNIIVIFSALWLGSRYGITGLAWGSLFAVVSQLFIQLPSLRRVPFNYRPGFAPSHPGLQRIFSLLPAILISSAVLELKHLLDRLFASYLPQGSIAALNYAERIYILPQGIFATAVIVVLYPTLVEQLARKDMASFTRQVSRGVSLLFFILMPIAAGLIILRRPLVELLFQRGAFDAAATDLTAYALLFYTPGLIGFALHYYANRLFFALQEVRALALVNLLMVAANALFNFLLMPLLGHGGIALGTSLAFTLGSLWLFSIFTRRLKLSFGKLLLLPLAVTALAAAVMSVSLYLYKYLWTAVWLRPFSGVTLILSASLLGALVYFICALLLRIPELSRLLNFLKALPRQFNIPR